MTMFTRTQISRRRLQLAARDDSPATKVARRLCHRITHRARPYGHVCTSRGDDLPITIQTASRTIFVMPDGEIVAAASVVGV